MEVLETIKTRRSIRHYKTDPVDDKTVKTVLEAAHWAPSWGNMQCWRFIVVRDNNIKVEVADTLTRIKVSDDWLENAAVMAIKRAPVLIVLCAEMGNAGCNSDGTSVTDKGDWYMFDVALAVENMVLAAHALGLGTVIVGAFDAKKVAKILGVPENFSVVTMTPLGFPAQEGKISPRKKLSDVIYNDKYGQ
jgi:nitroreductase